MEITKRELLVSISIFAVLISISIAFSSKIERLQTDANIKYETALQIDNSPEQYKYALETNVGNVFAYGTVQAKDIVSIDDVSGMYVSRELEKYTQHIRTRHYTVNGKSRIKIEHYWTWDHVHTDSVTSNIVIFLGREENGSVWRNKISTEHIKTESCGYHKRYVYRRIPDSFSGTKFGEIKNHCMDDFDFKQVTIKESLNSFRIGWYIPIYWVCCSILIAAILLLWFWLENDYLN